MSNCLNVLSPAWVLRESFVKIDVLVRKREPVVLGLQTTGNQLFLVEVSDLCVLRIVILEPGVLFQTLELVRVLHGVRRLGQEEPALKVAPAETFEGQLYGTLAAHLIDEMLLGVHEVGLYMLHRIVVRVHTVAEGVDGINSRQRCAIGGPFLQLFCTYKECSFGRNSPNRTICHPRYTGEESASG